MIEVRIRHEDELTSVHLMDWHGDNLDDIIKTVGRQGVYVMAHGDTYLTNRLCTQIVVEKDESYFEIIAMDEE